MSFIAKLSISLFALLLAPGLLAHEGHGGGSLTLHALEHGYMLLVPIIVVALIAWIIRRDARGRRHEKRIKSRINR